MTAPDAASQGFRHRLVSDIRNYLGRSMAAQVIALGAGLVVARVLGPTDYGLWSGLQLISIYCAYATLGMLVALNREIPIWRGRGDSAKVDRMRDASLGATLVLVALISAGLVGYSLWRSQQLDRDLLVGILFMAAIVGFQQLLAFFDVLFRSTNEFTTVGRLRLYRTVIEMSSAIVLVILFGFVGRMLAAALALFLMVLYAARRNQQPIHPRIDVPEVGRLVALGLPLMAVDITYGLLTSVDRLLILEHLDRTALGYYGVGLMAVRFLYILPRVVWETMYPRFGERYGETGSAAALERLLLTPLSALALLTAILLGAVVVALPIGVAVALPDYLEGLGAARILVCGSFFLGLLAGPGNFIHTISKRQAPLILAYGVGLGLTIVLIRGALLGGYGITGAAWATVASYAIVATVVLVYVFSFFFTPMQAIARLLRLYSPFMAIISVVTVSEYAYPTPTDLSVAAFVLVTVKLFLYGGVAAVILLATRQRWVPFLPLALSRSGEEATGRNNGSNHLGDSR